MSIGMEPREVLSAEEINLSDPDFWGRPWEEREGAFRTLRRERPVPFFPEFQVGAFPAGPGYWSLTRHADILAASHQPDIFSSARGATSIPDLPEEFLQFFGGMINMDDPMDRDKTECALGYYGEFGSEENPCKECNKI